MGNGTISKLKRTSITRDTEPPSGDKLYPWVVEQLELMKRLLKILLENDNLIDDGSVECLKADILIHKIETQPKYKKWAEKILNMDCEKQARILLRLDELDLDDDRFDIRIDL